MRIAEEFRTSQAPVREALRELETLRLVESEPYRGTGSARSASGRWPRPIPSGPSWSRPRPSPRPRLKGNVEDSALPGRSPRAAADGDHEGYARLNIEFHRRIVQAADNQILLQTWDSLGFETRVRITLARQDPDLVRRAATHKPILDALEVGDGPTAGRLLREHSESFRDLGSAKLHEQGSA